MNRDEFIDRMMREHKYLRSDAEDVANRVDGYKMGYEEAYKKIEYMFLLMATFAR